MSSPIADPELSLIKDALFQGQKIEAIKRYRKATGAGLAEAKEAVEKLEQELRTSAPDKFSAPAGKQGCLSVVMICVVACVLSWLLKVVK
jgi:hypothetical protein